MSVQIKHWLFEMVLFEIDVLVKSRVHYWLDLKGGIMRLKRF